MDPPQWSPIPRRDEERHCREVWGPPPASSSTGGPTRLGESRFTTVAQANAFAGVDTEGAAPWYRNPAPVAGVDACRREGVTVETPPPTGTLCSLYRLVSSAPLP
ncbi:hypothetical protein [Mycobacterium sp. AT1]|uniref:hypothetical protein n=1 Tax=Mycobacterium sp. AT1 TaxID=1961706 RepID=UPI0011528973|nr:hypothetical protein [Mycobacterium sp. AT1]